MSDQDTSESGRGRRSWWPFRRREERPPGAMIADIRTAGGGPDDKGHAGHGPRVGQVSTGSGGSVVPLVFGVILLLVILAFQFGAFRWISDRFGEEAPSRDAKTAAMTEAELAVAQFLRGASSMVFDSVRGVAAHEACGVVEDHGHDGGVSRKRFIFQGGLVRIDDGSDAFGRDWAKDCQPEGAVVAPRTGAEASAPPHRHRRRRTG